MKKLLIFIVIYTSLLPVTLFATPKEIIIIRHGDKLLQNDPGPTLSAKGQLRAEKFAFYYQEKFPDPDFIIAADDEGHAARGTSIREIQTVAPLANMLAAKHPETGFSIYHPYQSDQFKRLAKDLLREHQFDGKRVLICWEHSVINKLAKHLGIVRKLPKWQGTDFDTVYVIDYDSKGNVVSFENRPAQYPVPNAVWKNPNA